ncbi:MAG: hypothetical protein AAGA68_24260 [Pseudomonadota bacterium]
MISLLSGLRQPVILLGAAFFTLLLTLTMSAGFLGIWLGVVLLAALIRYPYALTASAADGAPEPPPAEVGHFNLAMAPPYLIHAFLLAALSWWLAVDLRLSGSVVALVMACIAPATVALMGATGSLFTAINPLGIVQLVLTLGVSYGAVVLIVMGLYALATLADRAFGLPLLSRFLTMYTLLAVFDISGRVLHLHRRELPFAVTTYEDRREISDRYDEQRDWEAELDRIYRAVRQGEITAGLAAMAQLVAQDGYRLEGYELLYARVREWHLPEVMLAYAAIFIERLVLVGELQRAMEVTEACLRHDPAFRPGPDSLAAIVGHARSVGHEHTAEMLTVVIDRRGS